MMKSKLFLMLALILAVNSSVLVGEATAGDGNPPWLKGINMPLGPDDPAPLLNMSICGEDGKPIPNEVTEDIPIVVTANSDIFFDDSPSKSTDGHVFEQAEWVDERPVALWFVNDWSKNKAFLASTSEELAINQSLVIPTTPTDTGSITCHSSRKMQYVRSDGVVKKVFANSSSAASFKVKDITPPTCGLDVSVVGGFSGQCWPVEDPPDCYPLPKTALMCFSGALFDAADESRSVEGYELGKNMIVSPSHAVIELKKNSVIKVKVIGDDNHKLDTDKLRYGISAGAGGEEPSSVIPENQPEIDFSKFLIPKKPYLYLDATDVTGNREILYIPIKIR